MPDETTQTDDLVMQVMTKRVIGIADRFLERLGEGEIESVWLIGSRGGQVNPAYPERNGKPHEGSDWDFLVVGDGFDAVEEEKISLLEQGVRLYGLSLDVPTERRSQHLDITFSSQPPEAGIKVWPGSVSEALEGESEPEPEEDILGDTDVDELVSDLLNNNVHDRVEWIKKGKRSRGRDRDAIFDERANTYTIMHAYRGDYGDTGFEEKANYKYFKEKYGQYLNHKDGTLGFDMDLEDEVLAALKEMPDDEWEQFQEDVESAAGYDCLDERERDNIRFAEEERYVRDDFVPDFKRNASAPGWATSYTVWFIRTYFNEGSAWDLFRLKEDYPEEESGSFYIDADRLIKKLTWEEVESTVQENIPVAAASAEESWRAVKFAAFKEIEASLRNQVVPYVRAQPERVKRLKEMSSEELFALVCKLVPDDNHGQQNEPTWLVYGNSQEVKVDLALNVKVSYYGSELSDAKPRALSILTAMLADELGNPNHNLRPPPEDHPTFEF